MNEKSTILLIDDHPMLRNGVKQLISLEPSLQVIGEAGDMEPEELIVALKEAASGKLVVSPTLASVLAESLRDNTTQDENHIASLTPREADILELISQGLSNKMIARKLDIAESTVKVHVKHLLKKLNLKSRVSLILIFL